MSYEITQDGDYYVVTVDKYPNLRHTIINNISYDEAVGLVRQIIDFIVQSHITEQTEQIRKNRSNEFLLYDKYQLTLMWQELTQEQRDGYIEWRNAWLNATETLIEPTRLDWFD